MLGLYLHIPFCSAICNYCNFNRGLFDAGLKTRYVDAVQREIRSRARAEAANTVYFGGGTPSLLPPESIRTILLDVVHLTPPLDGVEVTLEANPENVTPVAARGWRSAGVNRVSLGAQSFDDRVLEWMHRTHDSRRVFAAAATLHDAIRMHSGQGKDSAVRFQNLGPQRQEDLVRFLESLRAPG